jgi:hypothetical protein
MSRKILTIVYIVLVMVVFSLNETYSVTHKIFGKHLTQEEYSTGLRINSLGFIIHLVFFTILIILPVVVKL